MARPAKITAALFDFDGTLADTERFGVELDDEVYAQYGISPTAQEKNSLAGTDGTESIPALFRHYGMEVSAQEFFSRRAPNEIIYLEKPIAVSPGAKELMESLSARGVQMAVVSTTERKLVEVALKRLELSELVAFVIGGNDVSKRKPDPEPYQLALERLGAKADQAVAFEDSPSGVRSAMGAGVYTLGFAGSCVPQDVTMADEVFHSFEELQL
jgi:HAD superfamily hydrolase (TIGR01509 family)